MNMPDPPEGKASAGPPVVTLLRRFVGWFLEHLYTDLAWAYDLVAGVTSAGQWWSWQRAVEGALPSGPLLELGFGTGRLLRHLQEQGYEVVGVDDSAQMVHITRGRLLSADLPLRVARASALELPFGAGTFSGAYATFPSDFILEQKTLREVLRVLEPGGAMVVIPVARIRGIGLIDRLADWLYRVTGQSGPLPLDWDRPFRSLDVDVRLENVDQPRAHVVRIVVVKGPGQTDTMRPHSGGTHVNG